MAVETNERILCHVACRDLDARADAKALAATLSDDERLRAVKFAFERDRQRFIVARGLLRATLGPQVGIPPRELEFRYARQGKPELAPWCRGDDVRFNVSHSNGLLLIAVATGCEVGVDLEEVRPMDEAPLIAAAEFTPRERAALIAMPPGERHDAFFRAWVRKEAVLKAMGVGLQRPLSDVEVPVVPDEPARVIAIAGDDTAGDRWSIVSLAPAPNWIGAVAVPAPKVLVTTS